METNITKGNWVINSKNEIEAKNQMDKTLLRISQFTPKSMINKEESNAKLIADAANTANKCGLLPSELLAQKNDLLEAVIFARSVLIESGLFEQSERLAVAKCDAAINKATQTT